MEIKHHGSFILMVMFALLDFQPYDRYQDIVVLVQGTGSKTVDTESSRRVETPTGSSDTGARKPKDTGNKAEKQDPKTAVQEFYTDVLPKMQQTPGQEPSKDYSNLGIGREVPMHQSQ
jgi:hypothetical protein